jgi:hypothetical protein
MQKQIDQNGQTIYTFKEDELIEFIKGCIQGLLDDPEQRDKFVKAAEAVSIKDFNFED